MTNIYVLFVWPGWMFSQAILFKSCSIMANPAKAGDAKLRVYSQLRETDYDRRAAENDTTGVAHKEKKMTPMRILPILLAAFVVAIIASTTYAFAASNTAIPATAGDGANDVSGYTITNVSYSVNSDDPSKLDSVAFTLDASARTVRVKLSEASSNWYNCTTVGGNDWACATMGATIASLDQLRVSATSN